ncbi:MAG: ATP-binding protein [Paludibacter sp.]|nr:ATP-binding protein [Paludibacter sp.]
MIYFLAEDEYHYSSESITALREEYHLKEIVMFPDLDKIRSSVESGKAIGFISPAMPETINPMFKSTNFFEVIELKNRCGLLTTGQERVGISETVALKEKLGIQIHKPTLTLKDYGGAEDLIEEAKKVWIKERYGFTIKGFMLAGIPGTGKSHFAKCMAGETNRFLVELNLSQIMELPDTIYRIGLIFEYFINNPGRYIIWIDEIEKMLVGEKSIQVLGTLLTKINDLNSVGNGQKEASSLFVIATANNITDIAMRFPEFTRYGRFDLLIFMLPPTEENASNIFNLYINKAMEKFKEEKFVKMFKFALAGELEESGSVAHSIQENIISSVDKEIRSSFISMSETEILSDPLFIQIRDRIIHDSIFTFNVELFVQKASVAYGNYTTANRFIYTPAEIEFIVEDVFFTHFFRPTTDFSGNEYNARLIEKYQPLQVTMKSALQKMQGAAINFKKL